MIAFLKGTLAAKTTDTAYIDVNGVGYAVGMSATALSKLPEVGKAVQVFTYLNVREDAMTLFGFVSQDEKQLFEQLIGVSGVGPKMALAALSTFAPETLSAAIMSQDVSAVSRIPGVGKKTAQRIILELKGTLEAAEENQLFAGTSAQQSSARRGAVEALLSMGFTSTEADVALKEAPEAASEAVLLQYALKRLGD